MAVHSQFLLLPYPALSAPGALLWRILGGMVAWSALYLWFEPGALHFECSMIKVVQLECVCGLGIYLFYCH